MELRLRLLLLRLRGAAPNDDGRDGCGAGDLPAGNALALFPRGSTGSPRRPVYIGL